MLSPLDEAAIAIESATTLMAFCGLAYSAVALLAARSFAQSAMARRGSGVTPGFAPCVSILKPMKGLDAGTYAGLASHCRQEYAGEYEILFGVGSLADPAAAAIERLRGEFPEIAIRVVECPLRLGASDKVSSLAQMVPLARHRHLIVNDSDILVTANYLTRIVAGFEPGASAMGQDSKKVGMVTAPYLGRVLARANGAGPTVWGKLEALGIATDFLPGVLTARMIEGGIRFGLGSTLAVTAEALEAAGGFAPLADFLADDYELGARVAAAGFEVALSDEVVETTVPAYGLRGFWEHQLRWARSTRDSRKAGYMGLALTYGLPWAMVNCAASGFALWSFSLLSVVALARVAVALRVGVGVLRDEQVLRDLWLLPLRDCCGLAVWAWSYAGDTVVWRGERFRLRDGKLERI